jgi:hypothetical protein
MPVLSCDVFLGFELFDGDYAPLEGFVEGFVGGFDGGGFGLEFGVGRRGLCRPPGCWR